MRSKAKTQKSTRKTAKSKGLKTQKRSYGLTCKWKCGDADRGGKGGYSVLIIRRREKEGVHAVRYSMGRYIALDTTDFK